MTSAGLERETLPTPWPSGALWCLSCGLAAWLWFPCAAAVTGAVLGCLLATLAADRFFAARARAAVLVAWLVATLLLMLTKYLAVPALQAQSWLLLQAAATSGLASFLLLLGLHRATWTALRIPECALFALPWVIAASEHREGHLERPVALVEAATRAGVDPFRLFAGLGLGLGAMLILLLTSRRGFRRSTVMLVPLAALGCLALLPAERVARLNGEPRHRSAEISQEKSDQPLAVVVFYQDYDPELGVYHFAPEAPSELPVPEATSLHYRVAEIVSQPERLVTGWSARLFPASVANSEAFAQVYEARSQVLTRPLAEILDAESRAVAAKSPYGKLVDTIVSESERDYPLRAALRIKLWMEQNRPMAAAEALGDNVQACLLEGRPVGQKTYVQAAQALTDSLGLPTRLAHGFAVRSDQRGEGSFLLLSEQNQRWWLELWMRDVGWVVLDLYPLDGPSEGSGPENQALQRQLGELARARGSEAPPYAGLGNGALGFLLFLSIVALGGHAIRAFRQLRVLGATERLPVWGFIKVLDRLAEVGELRRSGETRHEFAVRLKDRVPSLESFTLLHQRAALGRPTSGLGGAASDNARPLMESCLREIAASYPWALRWAGACHPFAWMKVQ